MKHAEIIILTVLIFAFSGCATSNTSPNITTATISETPTVFCTVLNEPNPMLMGGWQTRSIQAPTYGGILNDPVEYWLVKNGDKYALYFYGKSRTYTYIGWKPFIIDRDEIRFSEDGNTLSPGYRKIKTENGKVYFVPPNSVKNEMTRIPEK
jgi:hypothetical protein